MMTPAIASAGDAHPVSADLKVQTSTDYYVKKGAKAFNAGDFDAAIGYSNKALESGLSDKRQAIAYSNICAANAAMNQMDAAAKACETALELRPGYAPAETNKAALTIMLAQK